MTVFDNYQDTMFVVLCMAVMMLAQLLVADFAGIKAGHRAGYPITADAKNFLFRAARAHANSNESIAIFLMLVVCAAGFGASPTWTATASWIYLAGRIMHMIFYYANMKTPRSVAFAVSIFGLLGLVTAIAMAKA